MNASPASRQRILRIRRDYNQWVANETLEDYALRFTATKARRWSAARVANTALGAVSFLALEAIGGTITIGYGFTNAVLAIVAVSLLIFATSLPIASYAARYGVDIDLLTRGAGFGYIGSTLTSLIYASFTFIFFAIEAVILAAILEAGFGIPLWLGEVLCAAAVVPLVTHGITFISRFQLWTQPLWLVLHGLPFLFIALYGHGALAAWSGYRGALGSAGFDALGFGAAASVVFSLVAQIGEQVDFLRFLPPQPAGRGRTGWRLALLAGGPGWILPGMLKLLAGSFLAALAVRAGLAPAEAAQPVAMYRVAFAYVLPSPTAALLLTGAFIAVSQVKINVTNAYAGSIAWSNFFARLTHSHPGRVVWLVFNIAIALLLMELGVYQAIEHTLAFYSAIAAAWMGALVADLVINKPLGLSPPHIEFKRAHLHDINPVGVGAMLLGVALAAAALAGFLGKLAHALPPFLGFAAAFTAAPLIAWATGGRFYLARKPRAGWAGRESLACVICTHEFEPEDMAFCPAYGGAICSLCCSLDARCRDGCKPEAARGLSILAAPLRRPVVRSLATFGVFAAIIGAILLAIYTQTVAQLPAGGALLEAAFWKAFFVLLVIAGVGAWWLVLALESRRVAREETRRQTGLLLSEIRAHRRTDAALQKAKEAAEAANHAKSRYVVGVSHELRTPLNAILGYAQLLEADTSIPERRRDAIRIIRRSGEHLAGLIEGLLDISKIEAGRIELYRDEVRLGEFLDQIVNMFRLQAAAKAIGFRYECLSALPGTVHTDERRLRQILINLLSNAIKFTRRGEVVLRVRRRNDVAEFEIEDTGIGIARADLDRVFEPFERVEDARLPPTEGVGLGLTITRLLAQIMGGDVTVASEPGRGSRFTVRLMLSEVRRPARPAQPPPGIHGYAGRRRLVLVADDDVLHRRLMQEVLGPIGFIVLEARDGAECLRLATDCQPDLFLIDLGMPGMSGWELARRLREGGHAHSAILIVSANAGELRGAPARRDHDDVLAKPVSVPALLERIGARLGLEWLSAAPDHAASDHAASDRAAPAVPEAGVTELVPADQIPVGLDAADLAELRRLGAIGYVRGIRARLDELERANPAAATALAGLRAHLAAFRLDAFLAALGEDPPP